MNICSEHQEKEDGCPRCHAELPDDFGMGEFIPCVQVFEDPKRTEMVLRDCAIVWRLTANGGDYVELGYDMESGDLVAVRINGDVSKRKPTPAN